MRIDLRIPDDSPLARVLSDLPAGSRAKVLRTIAEAALVPGGWAKIVQGQVEIQGVREPSGASAPPRKPSMDAQQAALGLLRKFGAFDDD